MTSAIARTALQLQKNRSHTAAIANPQQQPLKLVAEVRTSDLKGAVATPLGRAAERSLQLASV